MGVLCSKHDPCQGIVSASETHLIIEVKAHAKVDKLPPSSFIYTISLSSRLNDNKRSMAYTTILILNILVTSKSPIVTWQGPTMSL
jgi:hypothetical protein